MKAFLALGLLLVLASAYTTEPDINIQPNDPRVNIELYYESLCPYCHNFISGPLRKALETEDIWKIANFRLIPYGNAKHTKKGGFYQFKCQHGEAECQGNMVMNCALNLYNQREKSLPFILCLEDSQKRWSTDGRRCAEKHGMDWDLIHQCTNSIAGRQKMYENGLETKAIGVHGVPYVVVDGEADSSDWLFGDDIINGLCEKYQGDVQI